MSDNTEFLPGERLVEAAIFASREPVPLRVLATLLPPEADLDLVIASLTARYRGRGVEFAETGLGLMFRTAPDLAPALRRVVEVPRRLPRAAMETLAIIAYHQPVTRAEIEEIRGASLSQNTIDALIEADMITVRGFKEVPGRPNLWVTTPAFLLQFGLKDLRDLPKREELLIDPQSRPTNL
jgi:segregation and condensation protein B